MTTIRDFRDSYTTAQVAKIMEVSTKTVQTWCDEDVIKFTKTKGGHRRIPTRELDSLLERKKQRHPDNKGFNPDDLRTLKKHDSGNTRLLIVDDDVNILTLYKAHIESWGLPVEVTCIDDPFNALLLMGRQSFDVLITDIMMPGIDGAQMLQKIKVHINPDMLVLVVSSLRAEDVRSKYALPESVEIFEKPISFVALRAVLTQMEGAVKNSV